MSRPYGRELVRSTADKLYKTLFSVLCCARSPRQLLGRALPRRLVVPPAQQLRAVTDAAAAHVVERDLDHQLGPQRDPLQLLVALPAARVGAARLAAGLRRHSVDPLPSPRPPHGPR